MKRNILKYTTSIMALLLLSGIFTAAGAVEWQECTATDDTCLINLTGNVGIGTETPSDKLQVVGDITLGDGTDTSRYINFDRSTADHKFGFDNTIGLWNSGGFYLSNSIYIDKTSNFSGYYLGPNGDYGGFVKKNGAPYPLILSDTTYLGTDGAGIALAWDTIWDGFLGYCEGLSYDAGVMDCANYSSTMTSNDNFWIWKNGHSAQTTRKDLKFLFDGESNDGVMGFMEDENYFFYDNDVIFNSKVGIGTSSPEEQLHVFGNIKATGNIRAANIEAHYQDLAEWVPTSTPLTSATVVMINPTEINHVLPSDKEYNTLVAGVVSEQPGISLGVPGEGKAQIAHTGRVKVKVDTNFGGIAVGDLLVTSPVEGHAMKADNSKLSPGMLLGKALEPLTEGQQGEILVLLTLQ